MKNITVEDLKTKFVVSKVAPYGEVIMVPGGDFDPDWEDTLEEEGFGCVFTEINGEKFTLVKLEKDEEETATEPSHVPKREDSGRFVKHRGAPSGRKVNLWSDVDEGRLLKRIEEMPRTITFEDKCAQLVSEFPGRTGTGLEKKYLKLKRLEKSRSRVGKTLTKKLLAERESEDEQRLRDANKERARKLVEVAGDIGQRLTKLETDVAAFSSLSVKFEKYQNILVRLHSAVVMQSLEGMEREGILTIPAALRKHYAEALIQPNTKYADLFVEKCDALLEASS